MNIARLNRVEGTGEPVRANPLPRSATPLKTQRAAAKMGMAGSLGALFVSGFFKFHGAKQLHIYSGFGLLAFSVWHHFLNQPKPKPMISSPRSDRGRRLNK